MAVCDADVFGRKLKDSGVEGQESKVGERVLDVSGDFFKGKEMSLDGAKEEIVRCNREDATFNFVGKESVELARELGIVKEEGIVDIDGVPFALVLM